RGDLHHVLLDRLGRDGFGLELDSGTLRADYFRVAWDEAVGFLVLLQEIPEMFALFLRQLRGQQVLVRGRLAASNCRAQGEYKDRRQPEDSHVISSPRSGSWTRGAAKGIGPRTLTDRQGDYNGRRAAR